MYEKGVADDPRDARPERGRTGFIRIGARTTMARYAREQQAIQRAEAARAEVELVNRYADGAEFEVTRTAGNGSRDPHRVIWQGRTASAWRDAECSCEWGQKGGRGCWHVQAVRLAWEARDAERHAEVVAAYRAREASPATEAKRVAALERRVKMLEAIITRAGLVEVAA